MSQWKDPIPYDGRALLRLRRAQESLIFARDAKRIILETAGVTEVNPTARAGGDARKLRGVPVMAEGVGGAMANTRPEREVIRNDRKDGSVRRYG